jgi:hypothetical protein
MKVLDLHIWTGLGIFHSEPSGSNGKTPAIIFRMAPIYISFQILLNHTIPSFQLYLVSSRKPLLFPFSSPLTTQTLTLYPTAVVVELVFALVLVALVFKVVAVGVAVVAITKHCEYHSFTQTQAAPGTHCVGPS